MHGITVISVDFCCVACTSDVLSLLGRCALTIKSRPSLCTAWPFAADNLLRFSLNASSAHLSVGLALLQTLKTVHVKTLICYSAIILIKSFV